MPCSVSTIHNFYYYVVFFLLISDMNTGILSLLLPLLLIQLPPCEAKQPFPIDLPSHDSHLCLDGYCSITPDKIWHLQDVIRSNVTVIFEKGIYHMKQSSTRNNFIVIKKISNLSLIGHGLETQIVCSPEIEFGFYFVDVVNVTVAGLTITNCSALLPVSLADEIPNRLNTLCGCELYANMFRAMRITVTMLMQNSQNISVSNVLITNSPGFAIVSISTRSSRTNSRTPERTFSLRPQVDRSGSLFEVPSDSDLSNSQSFSNPQKKEVHSITIEESEFSLNQQGAIMLHGSMGVLKHSTLSNNPIGVLSSSSEIMLQDVVVSQSPVISMGGGSMVMSGRIKIDRSSVHTMDSDLVVRNGNVIFSNISASNFTAALTLVNNLLDINSNSTVHFTRNRLSGNASALIAVGSTITIQDNASLKFTNNSARDTASVFGTVDSRVTVSHSAELVFDQNFARNAWILVAGFTSKWNIKNTASFVFQNNHAYSDGRIAEFYNSDLKSFSNANVLFCNNSVQRNSIALVMNNASLSLYDKSQLKLVKHIATDESKVAMISGNVSCYDNTQMLITYNSVSQDSSIVLYASTQRQEQEMRGLIKVEDFGYYRLFMEEERRKEEQPRNDMFLSGGLVKAPPPGILGILGDGILFDAVNLDFPLFAFPPPATAPYLVPPSALKFSENYSFSLEGNMMVNGSVGFTCIGCSILAQDSVRFLFTNNTCLNSSYVLLLNNASTCIQDRASVNIANNSVAQDSSSLLSQHGRWKVNSNATFSVVGNSAQNGFSVLFLSTTVELIGTVFIRDNNLSDFGALNVINSEVYFQGMLECSRNRAESGAISDKNSDLYFTKEALFLHNTADNGGALTLVSSTMHISPNAVINFTRNHASGLGGAVYITSPRNRAVCDALASTAFSCSFQVFKGSAKNCEYFTISFNQNSAAIAGNAVYGDRTSACIPSSEDMYCTNCSSVDLSENFEYNGIGDASDLSNFTSDPSRVCFCEHGIPNCFTIQRDIVVYPGELFNLSLATIGYGFGTVPGSVVARIARQKLRDPNNNIFGSDLQYSQDIGTQCTNISYSILSEQASEELALAVDTLSFSRSVDEVKAAVGFQLSKDIGDITSPLRSPYDSVFETFFHIPVFVQVKLLPCPIGFQLVGGRCICSQVLLDNQIDTCSIANGRPIIHRPAPYWIGLPAVNTSPILVHSKCPYDYCQSESLNITPQNPNKQCQFQRSGILCGNCHEGLSLVLGYSECRKCSNIFLTLIFAFAVAGLVLVAFLTVLNMTVSTGTINGLIFYANIIQANQAAFLPSLTSSTNVPIAVMRAFIAWVNLDLGISTCFFDGLDAYVKTWLQFVFPLYILAIVVTIIIASSYFSWAARLFGSSAVPVLATLFLLSYTKMLRVLITAFSFTLIADSDSSSRIVWFYNGNVDYFELKHIVLFATALLVLCVIGIPYTTLLILAPWIQRSKYGCTSSLYNKFKPLFDAYMGPYKDRYRYWTGLLLLTRVALIVLFSSNTNTNMLGGLSLNLLVISLSASCLLAVTAAVKPYKKVRNSAIESFYLLNLVFLSSSSLYASSTNSESESQLYVYLFLVGTSFILFICISVYHVYIRLKSVCNKRSSSSSHIETSQSSDTPERETDLPADCTHSELQTINRERGDAMYRESVLDLNSLI